MPRLDISEEYGYRRWRAELTDAEYQQLLRRWATMRGLNCLVPVPLIVPQAVEVRDEDQGEPPPPGLLFCHIHECDDSYLQGSDYVIPANDRGDGLFEMEGRAYSAEQLGRWQDPRDAAEPLTRRLRRELAAYLDGGQTLGQFYAWFVPATWDIHLEEPPDVVAVVRRLEFLLDDYSLGHRAEATLKERLRAFVLAGGDEHDLA